MRFRDGQFARVGDNALLRGGDTFTLSLWMKPDELPSRDAGLIAADVPNVASPFVLSLHKDGRLGFEGFDGAEWVGLWADGNPVPVGEWAHVALTYAAEGETVLYLNGARIAARDVERALAGNEQGLLLGKDPYRGSFNGALDDVKIFASALSAEQIATLAKGETLLTRAATIGDFAPPTHSVELALCRYDLPIPFNEGLGRTRFNAERAPGPNAIDWPALEWRDGKGQTHKVLENGVTQRVDAFLREGDAARGLFQKPNDEAVFPGNYWFRPLQWMWGRRYVYSADRAARSLHNEFEIWGFPVHIRGPIGSMRLRNDGREIYSRTEKLDSLTLILPQNEHGKPYELSVNGAPFQPFDVGLVPIAPGNPKEARQPIQLAFANGVRVGNLERPAAFAYQKEWDETLAAMKSADEAAKFAPAPVLPLDGFNRYLGLQVPRSPLEIYTTSLPHGMSGGHFMRGDHKPFEFNAKADAKHSFEGSSDEYARFLKNTGFDAAYELSGTNAFDADGDRSYDALARSLRAYNLRFGVSPGAEWKRPFLSHPNLALFALNLPDYRAPLFRDVQLLGQRLNAHGNFAGISIGADNAVYESFWAWAPPEPGRPWAEAFAAFARGGSATSRSLVWPEPPSVGGQASVKEFQDYISRLNKGFEEYGYFERALREINPRLTATTGSYGSSPGVGARGGYPWATVPAKSLFANLRAMQAYDWNEVPSSKPLHNVALLDRARSYYPNKELRALVDDFGLLFGREARQRAYVLSLSRGIDAIGTQFLASPYNAKPHVYAEQKELFEFIKTRGGAWKKTRPDALIGVLYVNEQALLRKPNQEGNPADAALLNGSHEGKTTEALILAHAAGFSAKIVTPDELRRGLPLGMKSLLLVGLHREDESWAWSDGLEADLRRFIAGGGQILRDTQSVCPVPSRETGLQVRAYITQGIGSESGHDQMPKILARNADNIQKLRAAMSQVTAPIAKSDSSTVWAVPHTTGDVQYVTVVNWGFEPGQNASQVVKPQVGELAWNTTRAIYNVKSARKLSLAEAKSVDLTRDGFALYALPSRDVTTPKIAVTLGSDGFYEAKINVNGMRGVPVTLQLVRNGEAALLSGASGEALKLPMRGDEAGTLQLIVTELLSEQSATSTLNLVPARNAVPNGTKLRRDEWKRFFTRRAPLLVALTPEQKADPRMTALAARLVKAAGKLGRKAQIGDLEPNGVILSPQILKSSQTFPFWRTTETDLILLGDASNNPLVFDQTRGHLLPPDEAAIHVTYSPFVGEYNVLNLLKKDAAGLEILVAELERL